MGIFSKKTQSLWRRRWTEEGVILDRGGAGVQLDAPLLPAFLEQLQDDGHAVEWGDDLIISWDELYDALAKEGYEELAQALKLPPETPHHPRLGSSGALTDLDFSIVLSWKKFGVTANLKRCGAVLTDGNGEELMTVAQWRLAREVVAFAKRQDHDELYQRQSWGRIRKLAQMTGAGLDDFLGRTVVLTPDKLQLGLNKMEDAGEAIVEIVPTFEDAPPGWLLSFDAANSVRDRYDIVTEEGIVQVLVTPEVKTVLREIKRLPKRRATGARAKAILLNPVAALGDEAGTVIDPEQIETAREQAGIVHEYLYPLIERDNYGFPACVGLRVETLTGGGVSSSKTEWLTDDEDDHALDEFVRQLNVALVQHFPLLGWQGYEFELRSDAAEHLRHLQKALDERRTPHIRIRYEDIHNLANYSDRIEGIGEEKAYVSVYIKKDGKPWFPVDPIDLTIISIPPLSEGGDGTLLPVTPKQIEELKTAVNDAKEREETEINLPWLPRPLAVDEADEITKDFPGAEAQKPPVGGGNPPKPPPTPGKPNTLILKSNINTLDYAQLRREAAEKALLAPPRPPQSLRKNISLLDHQKVGLAWLQGMHRERERINAGGVILADDMGLGKTLQILAFMAGLLEESPETNPMLVVAPVSLLDNWREEMARFFILKALPTLTAYGDGLAHLRLPRDQVDERLRQEDGLVSFLKPGWVGNHKIVLTTYETLRNLEFSFALQPWSVMVCDEAQKIKNPAAMVTRAAKKQKAAFKIACTGTPVENTLADLWCLFDFIQPGLLDALDEFGKRYRKPIEARTEEEKAKVEELRQKIAPQVLRRLKADVAKDLKEKRVDADCRKLPLSDEQRRLYAGAIKLFRRRDQPGAATPFKNHLGLLHYLRLVCTDPKRHGLTSFTPEPLSQYRAKAPKLDWLLDRLHGIKKQKEKAIIFCEFREMQRLLQHYIHESIGLRPQIINGETATSAGSATSRQKQIRKFQEEKGFGVLILSPLAVGFGVNIQAANHVIHYTRTWNPAKEDQATDRAYRIGQEKDVFVYLSHGMRR